MLKKFKDFDVEQYRLKAILESLDESNTSDMNTDDFMLSTPISDDKYLLKMSRVIMKALKKAGYTNYVPYGTIVYLNKVPGVWFLNTEGEGKSIVACRNSYTKVIAVFNNFELGKDNKAEVTYSSEKVGLLDMINQAIDELKDDTIEEGVINEAFRAKAGYGKGHIDKVARWSESMKKFCVDALSTGMTPSKLAGEILKNLSNPICEEIYNSFDRKDTTLKYATNIIFDAMNKIYPEVEGVLDGSLAGVTPTLRKSIGDDYDVEEHEKEMAKKLEKAQIDFEESTELAKDIIDTFCHYVKQNGQLNDDDRSVFLSKGLYITGRAGAGKSYALTETLKKNGMVNKRDYYYVGNGATDAESLYRTCYKYNGKLIILDDSANIVGGSNRIAFWKAILQTDPKPVRFPRETRESSSSMYIVDRKTRQEQYFAEIGQKTNEERSEFFKKKRREYGTKELSGRELDSIIAAEWDEVKKNTRPLIPDEFLFTGCIVIIGNMTHEELKRVVVKDGGERDWDAIRQRFQPIEINPPYEVMWNVIQKQLREQQAMTEEELPSDSCIIPREYIDEFIDEVNYLLEGNEGPDYTGVSWRLAATMGVTFKGGKGIKSWKRLLRENLRSTTK